MIVFHTKNTLKMLAFKAHKQWVQTHLLMQEEKEKPYLLRMGSQDTQLLACVFPGRLGHADV